MSKPLYYEQVAPDLPQTLEDDLKRLGFFHSLWKGCDAMVDNDVLSKLADSEVAANGADALAALLQSDDSVRARMDDESCGFPPILREGLFNALRVVTRAACEEIAIARERMTICAHKRDTGKKKAPAGQGEG